MIHIAPFGGSMRSSHARNLPDPLSRVHKRFLTPFLTYVRPTMYGRTAGEFFTAMDYCHAFWAQIMD